MRQLKSKKSWNNTERQKSR